MATQGTVEQLTTVPLLIIDDLGMRKLPLTAAEELLEIIMRRYERASTLINVQQTRRRLGKTAGRQCRCHRHAGSSCCITDTFSSAARAVGEPKPAVREKANDKSNEQKQKQ